jgi:hypothetical protein
MAVIEAGKIEIEPFNINAVLELHMIEALNEHAKLYVLARLENEQEDKPIGSVSDKTQIKFKSGGTTIFSGVPKNIDIACIDRIYYLRLYAVSNTVLLDVEKKSRSFQDAAQKYSAIVQEVTADKQSTVTFGDPEAAGRTVENIILQYKETDWTFAKRLASHSNAVLLPKADAETPDFIFGLKDGAAKEKIDSYNYSVTKNLSAFREMSQYPELGFTESDAVSYMVTANDYIFNLGDKLTLDGASLYISSVSLKLYGSSLECTYALGSKNAVSAPKIFNNIIGLTLSGTVLKAIGDTVKVHLEIDDGQDEDTAYRFKYATLYSAEEHTGWYVMPEEGDPVQVIFPNEDEKYAYASWAIRSSESGKTDDPRTKYLRTADGKEIKLDEKEILITAKDGATFIQINEETGITITTPHPISVTSGSTITMTADDNFSIISKKALSMSAATISLSAGGGENSPPTSTVTMETSPGITVSSENPINVSGDGTIDMASKDKFSVNADKDFVIGSDKKVVMSGGDAIEASSKGSSIKMDGDIDLKAKLIKEN